MHGQPEHRNPGDTEAEDGPADRLEPRAPHEHRAHDRHEVPHRVRSATRWTQSGMLSIGVNSPLISR